jgi:hypothetical protein
MVFKFHLNGATDLDDGFYFNRYLGLIQYAMSPKAIE